MRVLDADAVAALLPYDRLIPALREGLALPIEAPPRVSFDIDEEARLLVMPAWNQQYLGIKTVNVFPRNAALGRPTIASTYLLSDGATGEALALIDGDSLTKRRTAAVAALAASFLAPVDADHLLLVGCGHVAGELPAALAAVRSIRTVGVWSRTREKAAALARTLSDQGIAAWPCDDLARAARTAPIIMSATFATAPLIAGDWLRTDAHLSLIGSFRPFMREADSDAVARSYVVADTRAGVLADAGDLLVPIAEGRIDVSHVRADLGELCRGDRNVPAGLDRPTIFKSVGHAAQDLVAALLCVE